MKLVTREATTRLFHPFQPFIIGQKTFVIKMAARFNIPLIFFGENPGEGGKIFPLILKVFRLTIQLKIKKDTL